MMTLMMKMQLTFVTVLLIACKVLQGTVATTAIGKSVVIHSDTTRDGVSATRGQGHGHGHAFSASSSSSSTAAIEVSLTKLNNRRRKRRPLRLRSFCDYNGEDRLVNSARRRQNRWLLSLRGGKTAVLEYEEDDENDEEDAEEKENILTEEEPLPYDVDTANWLVEQLCLYQTRISLISEVLAAKGYKVKDMIPKPAGFRCTKNTEEHPVPCRIYMDAAPGSKLVAPCKCKGSQEWISVKALNDLRRREPQKWMKCPTCQGKIDYVVMEGCMDKIGGIVSWVLNNRREARVILVSGLFASLWVVGFMFQWLIIRILVSGMFWNNYHIVSRIMYLPLPFKILIARYLFNFASEKFLGLEEKIRSRLTLMESECLERSLPVTITAAEVELHADD